MPTLHGIQPLEDGIAKLPGNLFLSILKRRPEAFVEIFIIALHHFLFLIISCSIWRALLSWEREVADVIPRASAISLCE